MFKSFNKAIKIKKQITNLYITMSISDSSSSPKLSNVQTSEPIKPQSKARKGQSEAEFLEQKQIWENTGPVIQETNVSF